MVWLAASGRCKPQGSPAGMVFVEAGAALLHGTMFYGFVWFLSTLGYWGAAIRLAVDLILLVSAFGTGSFDAFAKHLVPSLKPFDDRLDKALWWSFALGKYGGIAALEICTCVARLSLLVAPPVAATSWHTWVPDGRGRARG